MIDILKREEKLTREQANRTQAEIEKLREELEASQTKPVTCPVCNNSWSTKHAYLEENLTCSNCQLEFTWSFEYGRLAKEITADQKERAQRIAQRIAEDKKKEAAKREKRRQEAVRRGREERLKAKQKEEEAQQRRQKWENDFLKQLSPVFSENNSAKQKFREWLGGERSTI